MNRRRLLDLHILLLRAINVGGHGRVAMADLVAHFAKLGLVRPRSLLHAGSFVLGAEEGGEALEARIEHELEAAFGLKVDAISRTPAEWDAAIAANSFPDEAREAPAKLHLMALKSEPSVGAFNALEAANRGAERVRLVGRHLYIVYPDGAGTSKLTGALIERKLGVRGTARNWNTALKLKALADQLGSA
jgi:uncharacterized protein (DUF1697 family)